MECVLLPVLILQAAGSTDYKIHKPTQGWGNLRYFGEKKLLPQRAHLSLQC